MRARVRKAFTLVEILIVVVILGILAAIVVPQFTNATQDAQGGNIMTQLDTLNQQLELYRARNNGSLPADLTAGGNWDPATQTGPWATLIAQGYLKTGPRNPACPSGAGNDQYGVTIGAAGAGMGWNFADNFPAGSPDGVPDSIEAAYFDEVNQVVTTAP
jgi:general secretion pathway protein G